MPVLSSLHPDESEKGAANRPKKLPFAAFLGPHATCAAFIALSIAISWPLVCSLLRLSLRDSRYSHVSFVPFVSAGLLYLYKSPIFRQTRLSLFPGLLLWAVAGPVLVFFRPASSSPDALCLPALALVLSWIASFLITCGPQALRAAVFPLSFLFLLVPLPAALVDRLSAALQSASAAIAYPLFQLLHVPVFREGFEFRLPGLTIQIAEQCSGIRSTTALFITSLLVGYLWLAGPWRRTALAAATIFVAIFKNAVRIVFISAATVYYDRGFIDGALHHTYGGTVFSLFALALLFPVFLFLRKFPGRKKVSDA